MDKEKEKYVLSKFLELSPELNGTRIEEHERPDFVLFIEDKVIGVEITELIDQTRAVLEVICRENFHKGYSTEQIKENAKKKHGAKAENYGYYTFAKSDAIGVGPYSFTAMKKFYADKICNKLTKYNDVKGDYNLFYVVCDAIGCMEITHENEAVDVLNLVSLHEKVGIKVIIIYVNSSNGSFQKKEFSF